MREKPLKENAKEKKIKLDKKQSTKHYLLGKRCVFMILKHINNYVHKKLLRLIEKNKRNKLKPQENLEKKLRQKQKLKKMSVIVSLIHSCRGCVKKLTE